MFFEDRSVTHKEVIGQRPQSKKSELAKLEWFDSPSQRKGSFPADLTLFQYFRVDKSMLPTDISDCLSIIENVSKFKFIPT
jgi:hypothetical protein